MVAEAPLDGLESGAGDADVDYDGVGEDEMEPDEASQQQEQEQQPKAAPTAASDALLSTSMDPDHHLLQRAQHVLKQQLEAKKTQLEAELKEKRNALKVCGNATSSTAALVAGPTHTHSRFLHHTPGKSHTAHRAAA